MNHSFVFIILPVYNCEKYILQQLMSIYYQSFNDWYLIVVNDGSTDDTENVVKKFITNFHLHGKVELIKKENQGVNKAIESGLLEVKKKIGRMGNIKDIYISYCDSDDIWMRNKLEIQVLEMNKNQSDICYHDLTLIDENDMIIDLSFLERLKSPLNNIFDNSFSHFCITNHITSTSIMYKIKYIDYLLPMNKNYLGQDWNTCLIISGLDGKFFAINKPLAYYRRHTNQLSSKRKSSYEYFREIKDVLLWISEILTENNKQIAYDFIEYYSERISSSSKYNGILCILKHRLVRQLYCKYILCYIKNFFLFFSDKSK